MRGRLAGALASLMALAGCALGPLPVPGASIQTVNAIDAAKLPALAVGKFSPAPALAEADREIAIRASPVRPAGGSFARYLGETLSGQLRAAGKLDPASPLVVSGVLTTSRVSSAVGTGRAELAADFVLTRNGDTLFRKVLAVDRSWDSSFIGAAAIPTAEQGYSSLYPMLIQKLFEDPEFQRAARGSA